MITIEEKKKLAAEANRKVWSSTNVNCVSCHGTHIGVGVVKSDENNNQSLFVGLCNLLVRQGFKVNADPYIRKHYPILSPTHRYGRHGALECKLEYYPSGLRVEFFQNVNCQHPNGGYYDFEKLSKMPFLVRMRFEKTRRAIMQHFVGLGFVDETKHEPELALEWIFNRIKTSGHWDGSEPLDWKPDQSYNSKDANGKIIKPGETKYFYHYGHKRLCRGVVYYGLNNMWWVHTGKHGRENCANFELFDYSEGLERRRIAPKKRAARLEAAKRSAIEKEDYARAAKIRDHQHKK